MSGRKLVFEVDRLYVPNDPYSNLASAVLAIALKDLESYLIKDRDHPTEGNTEKLKALREWIASDDLEVMCKSNGAEFRKLARRIEREFIEGNGGTGS